MNLEQEIKEAEKTAQEAQQKAQDLRQLRDLSSKYGVVITPSSDSAVNFSAPVGSAIPIKRAPTFPNYDDQREKNHQVLTGVELHVQVSHHKDGNKQTNLVITNADILKSLDRTYALPINIKNVSLDSSISKVVESAAKSLQPKIENHQYTKKPILRGDVELFRKNCGKGNLTWIWRGVSNVSILNPQSQGSSKSQIVKLNKNELLNNDPLFLKEGFKNGDFVSGRVAELAHAKLNPQQLHLNRTLEMGKKDFSADSKFIDVKSVRNKNNTLRIDKRDVDNSFENCADLFCLYYVDDSEPEVFVVEFYGYVTKEDVRNWFNAFHPTLQRGQYYLMDRGYLIGGSHAN